MNEYGNSSPGEPQPPLPPQPSTAPPGPESADREPTVVPMGDAWASGVQPLSVSPRSRRLRWAVAGLVVACVLVATAAGAFVLSGAAGAKSLTASAAPKNAVAFLEIRTDLPGDQHAMLADFMSHFPGFADRAQFDNALDEALNKLTGAVSPDLTYTSAFKPWMEGEVSVAVMDVGSVGATGMTSGMMSGAGPVDLQAFAPLLESGYTPPGAVAIFALKDRTAAQSWVTGELARTGVTSQSQTYAGTTLYVIGSGAEAGAYAFTDQDLLLGTLGGVKAALDSKTSGSLGDNANYQAAMKSLSGDSLARFYIDPKTLLSRYTAGYGAAMGGLSGGATPPLGSSIFGMPMSGMSLQGIPDWVAGSIRAESSTMVVDVVVPRPSAAGSEEHTSRLAPFLPASTVGVFELHDIGKLVTNEIAAVQSQLPAASPDVLQGLNDALARIGGIDWLGDGVAVVTRNGSTYGGGVVVEATDAATASSKIGLLNLATLAGGSLHITTRHETYKGVTITIVNVPTSGGNPGADIAVAAKDNLILAGYTDSFVKAVIDTTSATSLAAQSDYTAVMAAAGASNLESFYVDVPALEDQIGSLFVDSPTRWTQDYKPYFDHLGGVGYSVSGGNTVILRLVVTAK